MHIATYCCYYFWIVGVDMSIGERIAQLRERERISQGELAAALNITRQAVSKWENDLSCPDTLNLIRLAEVLDSDVEYLATGRKTVYRRPPVVLKTVETVEKVVEVPVEKIVEVEKVVEKPTIQYIEKPVIQGRPVYKKVVRTKYIRHPLEYILVGIFCFLIGVLIGNLL